MFVAPAKVLMPSVAKAFSWSLFGLFILFMAVLSAFFIVLAPGLGVLVAVLIFFIATMVGAYAWARHVAGHDGVLAVYLLLLWVWLVNMPAIVAFDASGITRTDLFNPQSIGRIGLFFLVGLGFVINYLRKSSTSRVVVPHRVFLLLVLIYGWYTIDAFIVLRGQDLLLALYRVSEWFLLLLLIFAVISRAPNDPKEQEAWLLRVVFAVLLFILLITFVILPIAPGRAYFIGATGIGRLGNSFAHPNTLGVLAGMAFFYFLERKPRFHGLGMLLSLGVMVATYSRGAWLGFLLAGILYVILRQKSLSGRLFVVFGFSFFLSLAWIAQDLYLDSLQRLLARGGSVTNLSTASERTEVWHASEVLISRAPWLGHGFVAGPKLLNDVMSTGKTGKYFRAPHAHNEILQTIINGGAIAGLLILLLMVRTIYLYFSIARSVTPPFYRCLSAWLIMLWTYGMAGTNLSGQLLVLGGLLVYIYIVMEHLHATRKN